MRAPIHSLLVLALAACEPKSPAGATDSDSSSTTGDLTGMWAVGSYYRPGDDGEPAQILAMIDVKADYTALLATDGCYSDGTWTDVVGWEPLDEDSIVFVSLDPSEPLRWFGKTPVGVTVTLSRTERTTAFIVTDGKTADNAFMGEFRSKPVDVHKCLEWREPHLGCGYGTYVVSCPKP